MIAVGRVALISYAPPIFITGSAAVTEVDDTSTASGAETFTGTSATTEADDTSTASGTFSVGPTIAARLIPVATFRTATVRTANA